MAKPSIRLPEGHSMDEQTTEAMRALLECANQCVSRPQTLDNYVNYMATLSIVVLFSLLVQWRHRSYDARFTDLVITVSCSELARSNHPVLSLELSVAYTIWTLLPGTFDSMNLPSHADFMRTLVFIPTGLTGAITDIECAEEERRCQICLTEKTEVGQLPCGHHGCRECLGLMGHKIQTACPICRRPLFSKLDRAVFVLEKASAACTAVSMSMAYFTGMLAAERGQWWVAGFQLYFVHMLGRYLWEVAARVSAHGQAWWRSVPNTPPNANAAASVQDACAIIAISLAYLGTLTWNIDNLF